MSESQPEVICPYCGHTQTGATRCDVCGGLFEPLSRQATQNAMGPWFIRDEAQPFRPGCCYDVLVRMIERGKVGPATIVRGPTTQQFWKRADRVQGLSHLMGLCFSCGERVGRTDVCCEFCGAMFTEEDERQVLGLAPVRDLEKIAAGKIPPADEGVKDPLASVGYDRLRAAVEAAAQAETGEAARSALADAADAAIDSTDHLGVPRQPRRRRIVKEQLTPGQQAVERLRRERRQRMIKAGVGVVTVLIAAVVLLWVLAWTGAVALPFAVPGIDGSSGANRAAAPGPVSGAGRTTDNEPPSEGGGPADQPADESGGG
ncbi:MAG: hypothetical protein IT430_10205 [Phycisphaerales bacterium]|nr:hypothetical protein [Phycisphaerales bacterium]